ncbi:transposase, partial [uncultured Tateyamaria sp.]|uniref:integrase core domain-containing protein n=1 Tax=uncultured Tateyamaria sp. TaxID=455651 RepID=UPI002615D92D
SPGVTLPKQRNRHRPGQTGRVQRTGTAISPSPWEHGYCESFNGRMRDELLNGEVFYSLHEAQIIIERWRKHYNTKRPHSAPGYRPPAPEFIVAIDQRPTMH